jgi:hypothetical protein
MPRIMRRTPATEEAIGYDYGDLLKEAVREVLMGGAAQSRRMLEGRMTEDDFKDMLLGGVGGTVKMSGAVRGLVKRFSREGLKYDAFTEPLPGYGYHQWTLYGEGPTKGATFGTKTTELGEMEKKIAELLRKFKK